MLAKLILAAALLGSLQTLLFYGFSGLGIIRVIIPLFLANFVFIAWLTDRMAPKQEVEKGHTLGNIDPTLQIAHETLPYLRRGLNEETARKTAEIIQKITELPAVSITDREKVMAFLGVGCDKHRAGYRILTKATKQVLSTGQHKVVVETEQLNCPLKSCDCPLGTAVIVPLQSQGKVIGTLKLYQTKGKPMPAHIVRLALGIAQLLSMQTELAEIDRQTQLVTVARLDALHAQINPHFFFNTLNTIIMYSRTNPNEARKLLIHLADFFRQTLNRQGHYITLGEEIECARTYFALEKARFGEKIQLELQVSPSLGDYLIPVLSIQPLVENAVKHGLTPKEEPGVVQVAAEEKEGYLYLVISDNGVGIARDQLSYVLQPGYGSGSGVGLSNVHERLKSLYGEGLEVYSEEGNGTTIRFRVPRDFEEPPLEEGILLEGIS